MDAVLRKEGGSDKMLRGMLLMEVNNVSLPVAPFYVLGAMFVVSLAVFLWTTRKH